MRTGFQGRALVISSIKQGEMNRIVVFFSEERGRISALAHGSRKPGSRFGGLLEPGVVVDAVFRKPLRGSSLYTLSECSLIRSYSDNPGGLERMEALLAFLSFLRSFIRDGVTDKLLFNKLIMLLDFFSDNEKCLNAFRLFWMSHLLNHAGILPDWSGCTHCGQLREKMRLTAHGLLCGSCSPEERALSLLNAGDIRLLMLFSGLPASFPVALKISKEQQQRIDRALSRLFLFHRSET